MPGYNYLAVGKDGKEKRGKMESDSVQQAMESLKADGMTPVKIWEQGLLTRDLDIAIGQKVKPRDMSVFCRQFVSILEAGVPVKQALEMLAEQSENKYLRGALNDVRTGIEKGNTMADAMRQRTDIFPMILIHMVEAGEASGGLEQSFSRMAIQFEKDAKLKALIRKAMIYPVLLFVVCIGVVAAMLGFVIPQFIDMFKDLEIELPGITQFVIAASNFFTGNWYWILLGVIAVFLLYRWVYSTGKGRLVIDDFVIHMPLFGKLVVKTSCAQFARTTGTLMSTGISMMDCLDITSQIMGNIHFKNALQEAKQQVMKGIPLSEPIQDSGLFPPMVYHMTGIGEETGNLEEMLERLAGYYEEEVELTTQSVMAALEPLIIVLMALIVGVLVLAVITPIASLYSGLENV